MAFIGFAVKIANSIVQMITTAILNAGGYNGAAVPIFIRSLV